MGFGGFRYWRERWLTRKREVDEMASKLPSEAVNWVRIYTAAQKDTEARVGAYVAAVFAETKEQRLARGTECKLCRYLRGGRMSGQAFTDWKCRVCGKDATHPNTGTPAYCDSCCKTHGLCPTCGGKS